jgi:hypothetical protein
MNRNKLNIKMDLLRTAKGAFEINRPFDKNIAGVFLNKALEEFDKNLPNEKELINDLSEFKSQLDTIYNDPIKRIRWGEKVMTVASRLGSL